MILGADRREKMIINLPATVEMTTPNVYADQIEWMNKHFKNRDSIILSVSTPTMTGEPALQRQSWRLWPGRNVEGTLLGNGERTGNVDILNIAYNMFSQGINPDWKLRISKRLLMF